MKEDLDKFRKIARILLKGKNLTKTDIVKCLGVSDATYYKILNGTIDRIRASILGRVQDFNKTYIYYLETSGKSKDTEKVSQGELDSVVRGAKKMLDEKPPVCADETIWFLLKKIENMLPRNMSVQITINSRK
jgi:transcriptional regulator with XRE-family HTH domain